MTASTAGTRRVHAFRDDALGYDDATALAERVRRREVSPTELLESAIARCAEVDPVLGALVHTDFDRARHRATRLDKLEARGVLATWAPRLDAAALGYPLGALVHIQLAQARLEETCDGLARVREVLEVMSVAGEFDIVCRVVARDHAHLEEVFSAIIATPGVLRTRTEVILRQRVGPRVTQLLDG